MKWKIKKTKEQLIRELEKSRQRVVELENSETERKQVEERLKISEGRSRTWLEYSAVCTKIVDLDFNLQYMSTAGIKDLTVQTPLPEQGSL